MEAFNLLDELLNRGRPGHKDGETATTRRAEAEGAPGEKKVPFSLISSGELISSRM